MGKWISIFIVTAASVAANFGRLFPALKEENGSIIIIAALTATLVIDLFLWGLYKGYKFWLIGRDPHPRAKR